MVAIIRREIKSNRIVVFLQYRKGPRIKIVKPIIKRKDDAPGCQRIRIKPIQRFIEWQDQIAPGTQHHETGFKNRGAHAEGRLPFMLIFQRNTVIAKNQ